MKNEVNILLVDDEPRNLDVLESSLQSEDYRLVRALTSERALLELIEGDFAAIVLDIQMPEMSGFELANLIKQRKRTQHIPIIFLTAYYQEDKDVLEGYSSGAVDYLTKPINPQILRSKIGVFADLYRKSKALQEANRTLEQEVALRQSAEEALRRSNEELEIRVLERTSDLTRVNLELRQRESEVMLARDRALAASRAKDDFVARLSHELRTPLSPVLLIASEAASNKSLPPNVRADFKRIAENVELEARLIDDLLDLTRIVKGKLTLESKSFDFHTVIHDALDMVRSEIEQKRLTLRLRLSGEPCVMVGDDVRLRQVFWNLFKNAVKFTPAGGAVTVITEIAPGGRILVTEVTDTGIGMTAEEMQYVFEAFSQGDHASQTGAHRFGGLGLGLAISKMLIEFHGGSIGAQSAGRDQGATFRVELPMPPDSSGSEVTPPVQVDPETDEPPASLMRRILVVEDHAPTATALARLLIRRGYEVVSATCLREARAFIDRQQFDVLISDLGLPDGNGCELMQPQTNGSSMVGIALTGYGMDDDINRSKAAGFSSHLTKPVKMQELDRVLNSVFA